MKFDSTTASLLLALVCSVSGWVVWWYNKIEFDKSHSTQKAVESATKDYAAKRDFEHIKNNLKQMSDNIALGFKFIDEDFADGFKDMENKINMINEQLIEIKAYIAVQGKIMVDRE